MNKNKWKQAQGDKTFIYQLNDKGTNYFWLKVQSARTKDEASQEELEKIGDLIAAAPEILDALEAWKSAEEYGNKYNHLKDAQEEIAAAWEHAEELRDKAIAKAKAKGESNV